MTHIGCPYNKKTKTLTVKKNESVDTIVAYLQHKLHIKFAMKQFHMTDKEELWHTCNASYRSSLQ